MDHPAEIAQLEREAHRRARPLPPVVSTDDTEAVLDARGPVVTPGSAAEQLALDRIEERREDEMSELSETYRARRRRHEREVARLYRMESRA